MKYLLILPLLLSLNLFASEVQTLKVHDGSTAYCKNKLDQVTQRGGVYIISNVSVRIKNETAFLKFDVESFRCRETAGGFRFVAEKMYKRNEFSVVNRGVVSVDTLDARIKGSVDGIYDLVVDEQLANDLRQTISLELPLSSIETTDGKKQIDLWLEKLQRWENESSNYNETYRQAFGAFRIRF